MYITIALIVSVIWFIVGLVIGLSGKFDNTRIDRKLNQIEYRHPMLGEFLRHVEVFVCTGPIGLALSLICTGREAWGRNRR